MFPHDVLGHITYMGWDIYVFQSKGSWDCPSSGRAAVIWHAVSEAELKSWLWQAQYESPTDVPALIPGGCAT